MKNSGRSRGVGELEYEIHMKHDPRCASPARGSLSTIRGIFRDILGKNSRFVSHRKMQLFDSTGPHATGWDAEGGANPTLSATRIQ